METQLQYSSTITLQLLYLPILNLYFYSFHLAFLIAMLNLFNVSFSLYTTIINFFFFTSRSTRRNLKSIENIFGTNKRSSRPIIFDISSLQENFFRRQMNSFFFNIYFFPSNNIVTWIFLIPNCYVQIQYSNHHELAYW